MSKSHCYWHNFRYILGNSTAKGWGQNPLGQPCFYLQLTTHSLWNFVAFVLKMILLFHLYCLHYHSIVTAKWSSNRYPAFIVATLKSKISTVIRVMILKSTLFIRKAEKEREGERESKRARVHKRTIHCFTSKCLSVADWARLKPRSWGSTHKTSSGRDGYASHHLLQDRAWQ